MSKKEQITSFFTTVNRVDLGAFPTPLQRLCNTEMEMDHKGIFIKRDDLTGLGPGGNKIRSLEFILGEAVNLGKDLILVSGPAQSNLCTLASVSCAKLGLKCILVHNSEDPGIRKGNMLLNHILDVESHFIGALTKEDRDSYVKKLFQEKQKEGYHPYIIENGATTGIGALGYVNATLEIFEQVRKTSMEKDITIFAPGGNGGIATGLIYGNAILGLPFKINIISVEDCEEDLIDHIQRTITQVEQITCIPFNQKIEDTCRIIDDYRGDGWGINTAESEREVFSFAQTEGVFIENIYNSKVVIGMKDYIKKSKITGSVIYLHTGGFGSLFSQY
jgi:1-aminocyclopropane-1-carboxylate deaminase/D-cysteine desulfhydrase-like pyridoxal-dependent ACC family enzyme